METMNVIIFGAITGIWSFLVYFVFGLIAAGIAKMILPGKDPGGFLVTALVGILGAYLGHHMRTWLGMDTDGEVSFISPMDWVFTILGAIIILFIWKKIAAMISKN